MYLPSHVFSQSSCTRHKDAFRKVCWPCGQHVLLCQLLRTTNASWCQAEILPSCITGSYTLCVLLFMLRLSAVSPLSCKALVKLRAAPACGLHVSATAPDCTACCA
jgi:hypothetical protein